MKLRVREVHADRRATKDHTCTHCSDSIIKGTYYTAYSTRVDGGEQFETIKLHPLCEQEYLRQHAWFLSEDDMPTTSVEKVGFDKLLDALNFFHKRWQVETSNNAYDRYLLMKEENEEVYQAISKKSNVLEELGDQLGVVLGNIFWARANVDDSISIYGVMDYLAKKLITRSKFGYKVYNKSMKTTKMTHWQKVLGFLDSARDQWDVLSGPKHIHPEIRELLTQQEIEKLEKTGV